MTAAELLRQASAIHADTGLTPDQLKAYADDFMWLAEHVAGWHCSEASLPRVVIDPRFQNESGDLCRLIVTGHDGMGTVSLQTMVRMLRESAARATGEQS